LDAGGSSDPDGNKLAFHWELYPEAGTYRGAHRWTGADSAKATLVFRGNAAGEAHVVLTLSDNGTPSLVSYRRAIIQIR
jgi:hypothetical protein